VLLLGWATAGCDDDETAPACPPEYLGTDGDPYDLTVAPPVSCAFDCGDCTEPEQPYDCPAMRPWASMPHAAACGCWNGQYPTPIAGSCSASEPSGDALRKAGPQGEQTWVLPDGHIIAPAGVYASLDEEGLSGTFPMSLLAVPGTSLLLSSDGGIRDNALRLLDVELLMDGDDPSVAQVELSRPDSLFHGLAFIAPSTVLASGGGDGFVYAFELDADARTLVRDPDRDIDLGEGSNAAFGSARWYSGPLALSGDGTTLLVGPSTAAERIQVRSVAAESWGESVGKISIDSTSVFEIALDPADPNGQTFYATLWDGDEVVEIDLPSRKVTRSLAVGKNPEGLAFVDETFMAVASADQDRITLVDRQSWQAEAEVDLFAAGQPYGHAPTSLGFDPSRGWLYATLAGVNALAVVEVQVQAGSVTAAPVGRIPTAWWPTDVSVLGDGALVVLAGKGTGTGPSVQHYGYGSGPITSMMHGGVQYVPPPSAVELSAYTATAEGARQLAQTSGYPEVSCPSGAYDFPVPASPAEGPSEHIRHIVFIVRENKTYDAVFGDLEGTDGDADLVMAPGEMEEIWPNARLLARSFTNFDNFYTDAEQSVQGHVWTAYGRSTDFIERSWLTSWGRGTRAPTAGISVQGQPEEGSLFDALDRAGVPFSNMGEIIGIGGTSMDPRYPGLVTTIGKPDNEKACYIAGHARALCDLPGLIYAVMPNDHTFGGDAGAPHPGVMVAVNDEATGMVVDAVSRSPFWPGALVIVTEDDPQDGGDHVDVHRTLLFMASPWVKRGYVSKGHYDMSSVLKLIVTILGVPYPNEQIAQAAMPYDAFTATPDYTPYDYIPRGYDQPCNPYDTRAAAEAQSWDFAAVDEQPGIQKWIWRILHDKTYD